MAFSRFVPMVDISVSSPIRLRLFIAEMMLEMGGAIADQLQVPVR